MTAPEIPHAEQLADAQAAADRAQARFREAVAAMHAARGDYMRTRLHDAASQTTDQARQAWADALRAQGDAQVAMERARDELTAIHRQTADYAVTEGTTDV